MLGKLFHACRGRPIRARQQDSPAPLLGQALLVPALVQTNQRHPRGIARLRHLLSESGDQYLILNSGVGDGLIWHVAPAPCYFAECSSRSCVDQRGAEIELSASWGNVLCRKQPLFRTACIFPRWVWPSDFIGDDSSVFIHVSPGISWSENVPDSLVF
ncbi:hypothetical protein ASPFODRAFT_414185 [Aspergillus luchuensis CBS 106.47]|uniref:Uncharacterized protein n=1 Tax=Aspergillus luchuensis (strain CBS 106.47) TaxID=1137211 RepID=A0A1M3TUI0_ASPLC|nr:hypothetical protein ASPFODRAFT_414185 [Aspergillus luchuensis CBS 106.47]